ncbi:CpsD/CapB family tyrosine-protein kinase [Phascolarctobacterium sp.]
MEGLNLVTQNDPKNPAAEAYRVIRTSVQFAQAGKELQTIALTSCTPNEGKSTTIANLAVVLTQAGKSVLLIDCDMRNPTVHKNFNLSNKVGLSSCISMGTALADAVQKTNIEGLDALTAGVIPPNPSELLGSERMQNVLQRAKEQYDYVLIDTPPVMPFTDALIVSRFVDGMILVIASAEVKVEMAREVKNQLVHSGANILGVVLNKVRSEHHGYGYGYYYYYGNDGEKHKKE